MDKLTHKEEICKGINNTNVVNSAEDSNTFIKRLSDSDDDFTENTYDGYVIELEDQSYDP